MCFPDLMKLSCSLFSSIRGDLNLTTKRILGVLDPIKVVLTNLPESHAESFDLPSFPPDVDGEGSRSVPFHREIWIERTDFAEDPPKGFRRLVPNGEVRLRGAYVIRCDEVLKDEDGMVTELRCSVDRETQGGGSPTGRKVRGTIQRVSVSDALDAEVRLFSALLTPLDDDAGRSGTIGTMCVMSA